MSAARKALGWWVLPFCGLAASCIGPPLVLGPEQLPDAITGSAYSQSLTTDGQQPVSWQVGQGTLPPGLRLDTAVGVIAGTPTAAGSYDFSVLATDGSYPQRTGEKFYSITIVAKLTLDVALPQARVGEAYNASPTINGGVLPYHVIIVGLPAGLDYDGATGRIFGTPLNDYAGLHLEITVTDSGLPAQTITRNTTLVVRPPAVSITTTSLPGAKIGTAYSEELIATNGRLPYLWTVAAGVLPDGLRLDRFTGTISGTPTAKAVTQTFTISVADSDSPPTTRSRDFTIEVAP